MSPLPRPTPIARVFLVIGCAIAVTVALTLMTQSATNQKDGSNRPLPPKIAAATDKREAEPFGVPRVATDQPDEAARFRWIQRLSEDGTIPHDALLRAKQQRDAMLAARGARDRTVGGISPDDWTWLGPGNIGGRIRSILVHPQNPDIMWVGSVSGGIWKTYNAGEHWEPLRDFMASLAVCCMAMDPHDPNVLYAGTGEGFLAHLEGSTNTAAMRGAGVFCSTDGGTHWNRLASTAGRDWYYVNRLAVSPIDSLSILAATNSGLFRTADGGASWTQVLTHRFVDVKWDPSDGSKAVAARLDPILLGGNGLIYHTTDAGVTWIVSSQFMGDQHNDWAARAELAYAGSDPSIVYASVNVNQGEIWRSTDGGITFALQNTRTRYLPQQGWYNNTIWVSPTDPDLIVVGGIDLWRSANAGLSLQRISAGEVMPLSPHVDHHAIVAHAGYDGGTNRVVFFANDGGIYRADDIRTAAILSGWVELNNNLGITQFYGATANTGTGQILGGTQDNGLLWYNDGTESWTQPGTYLPFLRADGGMCASDSTDSSYWYGEWQKCKVLRSEDGGAWFWPIYDGIADAVAKDPRTNFIAPLVLDPNNPNRLLTGARELWRTDNAKVGWWQQPTWESIKEPAGSNVSAVAVAEGNSDVIWVGHNDGALYVTSNGTASSPTWARVDNNSDMLPNRWCSCIAIDPHDHDRIYVTLMGYEADNVWRTTDGGATWQEIEIAGADGTVLELPVSWIALHPTQEGWLYVATDLGVFTSDDDGETWATWETGPANVTVDQLIWQGDSTLIAVTHGRGIFAAEVGILRVPSEYPTIQDAIDAAADGVTILVAPGTYYENIDFIGKEITVRSDVDGDPATDDIAPGATTIDGSQAGSVVTIQDNMIEGFTITNGSGTPDLFGVTFGGGVLSSGSSTIRACVITFNSASVGAAVSGVFPLTLESSQITNCVGKGHMSGQHAAW